MFAFLFSASISHSTILTLVRVPYDSVVAFTKKLDSQNFLPLGVEGAVKP